MLTILDIKDQLEEWIKMADADPNHDGKMLIGEEFEIIRDIDIYRRTLISLMNWIEENEK